MKKNINIFCCVIFVSAFSGINKNELAKFKTDSQKFSQSIDVSKAKVGKIAKDDVAQSKASLFGSLLSSKTKDDSQVNSSSKNNTINNNSNNNNKSKASLFGSKSKDTKSKDSSQVNSSSKNNTIFDSLFGSKSKDTKSKDSSKVNTQNKNNNKINEEYEDPFGGLDANLFESVGKTKLKSEEKQANTDKKKAAKKAGQDKEDAKKKDSGFFSSLASTIKSGAKSFAKSELGQQVSGALKNSAASVASNAINTGTEKLNEGVTSLNNKISGQDKKELEIQTIIKTDDTTGDLIEQNDTKLLEDDIDTNSSSNIDKINEADDIKAFSEKLDRKPIEKVNSNSNVVQESSLSFSTNSGKRSSKSKKNKKKKSNKKR
jgi:hypothetical protein